MPLYMAHFGLKRVFFPVLLPFNNIQRPNGSIILKPPCHPIGAILWLPLRMPSSSPFSKVKCSLFTTENADLMGEK